MSMVQASPHTNTHTHTEQSPFVTTPSEGLLFVSWGFYIIATFRVIYGRVKTCDCVHLWRIYSALSHWETGAFIGTLTEAHSVTLS